MEELNDYSGPYKPDLKWEDFSKEFLIKLMKSWQNAYLSLSAFWHEAVKERSGSEVADDCDLEVWQKVGENVVPRFAKVANIQLNTVLDSLKLTDMCPDSKMGTGLFEGEVEVIDENHVIATTTKCRVLEALEKTDPTRIDWFCKVMEPQIMQKYLNNPRIKVTPLKMPPRSSPDEIPCQFDIRLEE
jgi:hypothetical protein